MNNFHAAALAAETAAAAAHTAANDAIIAYQGTIATGDEAAIAAACRTMDAAIIADRTADEAADAAWAIADKARGWS